VVSFLEDRETVRVGRDMDNGIMEGARDVKTQLCPPTAVSWHPGVGKSRQNSSPSLAGKGGWAAVWWLVGCIGLVSKSVGRNCHLAK